MNQHALADMIRNIPDFPQPGIQFKDITTLLRDGEAFQDAIQVFVDRYRERNLDAVVAIESRGFILGAPLAYVLGVGVVPVRKPGKLPAATYSVEYELEYGTNKLEIHKDALQPGSRVLIVDDLLATGGTTAAACGLVEQLRCSIEELSFLIELSFLNGREKLSSYSIFSLIQY
jgi:adenine phosphoribosyltransferase